MMKKASLEPYPDRDLLSYLSESALKRPTHNALQYKSQVITYGDLWNYTDIFSGFLNKNGVKRGDRIVIILPNSPQFLIAEMGAWKVGAIVAPINPSYPLDKIEKLLLNLRPKVIVTFYSLYEQVSHSHIFNDMSSVIVTTLTPSLPLDKINLNSRKNPALQSKHYWLADILREYENSAPSRVDIRPEDDAVILMSSGTLEESKQVLGQHKSFVITALQIFDWARSIISEWNELIMCCVPLFHAYGNIAVQSVAFITHNTLCLIPELRNTNEIINTIRQAKPSIITGIPVLLDSIVDHENVRNRGVDLHCIKLCFSGASRLSMKLRQRLEELTGGKVIQGYSLTEAMMACIMDPFTSPYKQGSVGLPLPDIELKIVGLDSQQRNLGVHEVGEIALTAPQLMKKYWLDESKTEKIFHKDSHNKIWLLTGDVGEIDDDGYLYVIDRKDEIISLGDGEVVLPSQVEDVILEHPAVARVGVRGIDLKGSTQIVAWIVPKRGLVLEPDDIKKYCVKKLPPNKLPHQIEIRDNLPTSGTGKVLRKLLR